MQYTNALASHLRVEVDEYCTLRLPLWLNSFWKCDTSTKYSHCVTLSDVPWVGDVNKYEYSFLTAQQRIKGHLMHIICDCLCVLCQWWRNKLLFTGRQVIFLKARQHRLWKKTTDKKTDIICRRILASREWSFWRAYVVGARKVIRQTCCYSSATAAAAAAADAPINSHSAERSFIGTRLCSCLFYWCAVVWRQDADRWLFLTAAGVFPAILTRSLTRPLLQFQPDCRW